MNYSLGWSLISQGSMTGGIISLGNSCIYPFATGHSRCSRLCCPYVKLLVLSNQVSVTLSCQGTPTNKSIANLITQSLQYYRLIVLFRIDVM